MSKWKTDEVLQLHNNIAKRKGLPAIALGTKMSLGDAVDKLEAVNKYVPPKLRPKTTVTKKSVMKALGSIQIHFDSKNFFRFSRNTG